MGTRIEGPIVVKAGLGNRHRALRLAVQATGRALDVVGLAPSDIDLLVNAGLYHDRNLGEPALAPLIQQDARLNPEDPHPDGVGTFSFDVANGACGVLTALQIADRFLRAGTIESAVVVAEDADPGRGLARDFPFTSAAGALVCRRHTGRAGLGSFGWSNRPDGGAAFRATIGGQGQPNVLMVAEDDSFAEAAGYVAAAAVHQALDHDALTVGDVDLIVASPGRPLFAKVLSSELAISDDRVLTAGPDLHTVALIAALEQVTNSGLLHPGVTALIVSAGAGITAGAALYRC